MPYVTEDMRERLNRNPNIQTFTLSEAVEDVIDHISQRNPDEFEGLCNYAISRIVSGVMKPSNGWKYRWLNRAHGTFLSAAAEFYRRVVAPYEDECIRKNGDIPEYQSTK